MRLSPLHDRLQSLNGTWRAVNHMPSLIACPDEDAIAARLGMADLSCLTRFGVKGAGAAAWLAQQGVPVPDRPNSWLARSEGGLVARLGRSEFLIEDGLGGAVAPRLAQACQQPPAHVYPVLRQDAAIGLCGDRVDELLRQTCSVNFGALCWRDRPVILTSMIGVAVTVVPGDRAVRIWCDGTFGAYVWQTLLEIAAELGGGAVGIDRMMQNPLG